MPRCGAPAPPTLHPPSSPTAPAAARRRSSRSCKQLSTCGIEDDIVRPHRACGDGFLPGTFWGGGISFPRRAHVSTRLPFPSSRRAISQKGNTPLSLLSTFYCVLYSLLLHLRLPAFICRRLHYTRRPSPIFCRGLILISFGYRRRSTGRPPCGPRFVPSGRRSLILRPRDVFSNTTARGAQPF